MLEIIYLFQDQCSIILFLSNGNIPNYPCFLEWGVICRKYIQQNYIIIRIRWLHSLIISSLSSSIDGQEVIVAAVENIMWQNQSFPMSLGADVL